MTAIFTLDWLDEVDASIEAVSPRAIRLEKPVIKLADRYQPPEGEIPFVAIEYDYLYFSVSAEDKMFGWYLRSTKFVDAVEPLFILQALKTIASDDGDIEEAFTYAATEWLGTFFHLVGVANRAIESDMPNEELEARGRSSRDAGKEFGELLTFIGIDITDYDAVAEALSSGRLDMDPSDFREER